MKAYVFSKNFFQVLVILLRRWKFCCLCYCPYIVLKKLLEKLFLNVEYFVDDFTSWLLAIHSCTLLLWFNFGLSYHWVSKKLPDKGAQKLALLHQSASMMPFMHGAHHGISQGQASAEPLSLPHFFPCLIQLCSLPYRFLWRTLP